MTVGWNILIVKLSKERWGWGVDCKVRDGEFSSGELRVEGLYLEIEEWESWGYQE